MQSCFASTQRRVKFRFTAMTLVGGSDSSVPAPGVPSEDGQYGSWLNRTTTATLEPHEGHRNAKLKLCKKTVRSLKAVELPFLPPRNTHPLARTYQRDTTAQDRRGA